MSAYIDVVVRILCIHPVFLMRGHLRLREHWNGSTVATFIIPAFFRLLSTNTMENVYSTVDISVLYGVNLYRVFVCCVKDAPCVDVSAMDSRAHVMRPAVVVVVGVIRCMCMSNWIHNIQ